MFKREKSHASYLFTVKRKSRGRRGNRQFNPRPLMYGFSGLVILALFIFTVPYVYANPFKKINVVDGYGEYTLLTKAKTVGDIYSQGSLNLKEKDATIDPSIPVTESMTVYVDRSIVVNVVSGGTNVRVRTKGRTARDVLTEAGIVYRESDAFNVSLDDQVKNGSTLVHAKVETKTVTKRMRIDFDTVTVDDNTIARGKTEVVFSGEDGYKNISYLVTYQDGAEISRVVANEKVVKEPVSRKVAIGTMEEVASASAPSSGSGSSSGGSSGSGGSGSSGGSSGGSGGGVSKPNRPVNPPSNIESPKDIDPARISKTKVMNATAYTHTGRPTASGVMPSRGTIAVNTSEIPMGTKLYIPGYGMGVAQDTGRLGSNTIDLFMDTYNECIGWGRKSVTVYILKY